MGCPPTPTPYCNGKWFLHIILHTGILFLAIRHGVWTSLQSMAEFAEISHMQRHFNGVYRVQFDLQSYLRALMHTGCCTSV